MTGSRCARQGLLRQISLLAGVAAAMMTAALVIPAVAESATGAASTAVSTIAWKPCDKTFFCAKYRVPLDYDHPGGRKISIALIKRPATDPAHRIGSLFVNPGGPGGSGVDFVLEAGDELFTPQVRARFDIVGFDPRGIGQSTPARCFDTEDEAAATFSDFPYPNSPRKTRQWIAKQHQLDAACASRGNPVINHMATADAARDLDRLRQAVGDSGLTYYGVSYGSFLGNTYANLFPKKVRSLVIDGVLNPVAWTTGRGAQGRQVPFATRLRSAVGARATLHEFFRLCDAGGARCAFAPHAASRYAQLYRTLQQHPIQIKEPGEPTIYYDESYLVGDTLGALYDSASWPDFATYLVDLERQANPVDLVAARAALHRQLRAAYYENFVEGFPAVACSDSINPDHYRAWRRAAAASSRRDGMFGPIWTWASSICADWPGHDNDRYLGPFTHHTAHPVLVVGNLSDPATPYHGAVVAARLLPNSRLLTVHGWGHTSLFLSACADQAIGRYLLTSQTPPAGTVCNQDVVPFATSAPASQRTTARLAAKGVAAVIEPLWSAARR